MQKTKGNRGEKGMAKGSNTGTVKKRPRGRPKKQVQEVTGEPIKKHIGRPKGSKSDYTVSEKALAQRKGNADAINSWRNLDTPEAVDYNTRLIGHIMQINEIASHADRNDINTLRSCFINYLKLCQVNAFPVQNMAAYAAMGFPSNKHFEIFCHSDNPEKRELYAFVKSTCSMFREGMISEGKLNPVIGIFWQRNFDGLRNDTEQVQAVQEQEDEYSSGSKSYKDKYKNLIGE